MRKNNDSEQATAADCRSWSTTFDRNTGTGPVTRVGPAAVMSSEQLSVLEQLISNNVVPRLLLGSRTDGGVGLASATSLTPVTEEHVGEFAELVISRDISVSMQYFEDMRSKGATVEVLFQDLLAPVARRLGELWSEDINDFMDVTRGAGQLQQIVREYSDAFHDEARQPVSNRRALLMPMPGEQHIFGIALVGEHYRRAGWHVWGGPPRTLDDILTLVSAQWFDVIGLSVSRLDDPAKVASEIARIRQRSMNRRVLIQIGGKPFADDPELVSTVGADSTAIDGREAVLKVTALMASAVALAAQ